MNTDARELATVPESAPEILTGPDGKALSRQGSIAYLVVLTGPHVGERVKLDRPILIGRAPEADLRLQDPSVSWRHARVEPRGGGWAVVDLGSERGTEVGGMRVSQLYLSPDDQLMVGGTVLRVDILTPIEAAFHEEVETRLYRDHLTGLWTRRKFDLELKGAIEAARHEGRVLSLLVFDLDHLKKVNDTHGHLVGARVIAKVGEAIGKVIGDRGYAARLGGDEYGVILPSLARSEATELGRRVLEVIEGLGLDHLGMPLSTRLSGGIAVFPEDADSGIPLYKRADEALYRAKADGGARLAE